MGENIFLIIMIVVQVVGVFMQCIIFFHYKRLMKEAMKLQQTTNESLKQMKLKYENYKKLEVFVPDKEAFINRYLDIEKVCGIRGNIIEKGVLIGQIVVLAAGLYLYVHNPEKGIIALFLTGGFYYICKLFDFKDYKRNIIISIREYFSKVDYNEEKFKNTVKNEKNVSGQAASLIENIEKALEQAEKNREISDSQDEVSNEQENMALKEAAVYDMLSEFFGL